MRRLVVYVILLGSYFLIGCSLNSPGDALCGIDDPPLPSTESICPLIIGNHWEYWSTWYDTNGIKIQLSDRTLFRSIPGGYLLFNDDTLISPENFRNSSSYSQKSYQYVYKYEWENLDSGLLLMHIGSGDLNKRGLYIVGEYAHQNKVLYEDAVLWLSYPSTKGTVYQVALPGRDSSETLVMQVMETATKFYAPIENRHGASPVYFRDSCYLYKESDASTETYYYYHPAIGCLGYLKYRNGKLITTYTLKKYLLQ
ncbi:MAG: hypothetical protein JW915_08375 [Chitinispirillaceae bacterium]|nr:hypothetical protein [Chitinispirillaceae bacterium]